MSWPTNDGKDEGLIVLFTKDNVDRLEKLDDQYADPPFDVVLLDDSSTESARRSNREFAKNWEITYHGPSDQQDTLVELDSKTKMVVSGVNKSGWTLGHHRTYAILMADKTDWNRLLMIDDDIDFGSWQKPKRDFERLDQFPFVGSNIVNMPDSSIVGYLFRASGIIDESFLSGAYLGIRLDAVDYPFPNIYNEDWIWVLRHCSKESIPIFGSVTQLEYDWTTNAVEDALFQEIGEIVMEAILRADRLGISHRLDSPEFWNRALQWRKNKLRNLEQRTVPSEVADIKSRVLDELYQFHADIYPEDIVRELNDWVGYDEPFP